MYNLLMFDICKNNCKVIQNVNVNVFTIKLGTYHVCHVALQINFIVDVFILIEFEGLIPNHIVLVWCSLSH